MLVRRRLQETIDEAVRRARMTRADAEELKQVVVEIARHQVRDAVAAVTRRLPPTSRTRRNRP